MHDSSYLAMMQFMVKYLAQRPALNILDVGSMDVNGTYKALFNRPGWHYVGCDMEAGSNVDVVLKKPYDWEAIPDDTFDAVISGQSFEHIEYIWVTISEIARVMKPGGLCCIIAPSSGPEHKYPYDCWRIYPDGFRTLAKYGGLEEVEVKTDWNGPGIWHDSVLIGRKPVYSPEVAQRMRHRNRFARLTVDDEALDRFVREHGIP
ncbi:hypothetical protein J19TS2_48110 [Cohnella xylanilytica]|uniref:class I SAM-dependent methyltransferase n=1 Tax=Cohnella xylanilytica TaxID=557555 RepID=UPI001B25EF93|nr:class I SAM-dependent methyltransferase [Cohnella xylanilytica]GIO15256.1 hypothetical protein J19TS2_48110 [Cohnella xylanilytica]